MVQPLVQVTCPGYSSKLLVHARILLFEVEAVSEVVDLVDLAGGLQVGDGLLVAANLLTPSS